jgi:hypothetical protein
MTSVTINRISLLTLFAALLSFNSCRTINIARPPERYDTAQYHPQYSNINIPLEISAAQLKKLINRRLSGQLYADTSFDDNNGDGLMIFASKKDSIDVGFSGGLITYRIPLKIWLRKRTGASIAGLDLFDITDAEAEVALKFRTKLSINRDWTLSTLTQPDGYDWIKTPRVTVGGVQIPLPGISDVLLNGSLGDIAKAVDRSVKTAVNLRQIVGDAWTGMQKPALISPADSLWLKLTPVEVSSLPVQGKGTVFSHSFGLRALVELYYGKEPVYVPNPALPPLKITSAIPELFAVNLSLDLPFSYINALARKSLRGYSLSYGSYKLTLTDVRLYGQGEQLIVEVPVEGSVRGTIYLSGIPVFNRDSLRIELDRLDFSVATKNVAVKTASWLFHSGLVQKLKSNLVFPVGQQLKEARESLAASLRDNRSLENLSISGNVTKLEPQQIRICEGSVKTYYLLEGKLRIKLIAD